MKQRSLPVIEKSTIIQSEIGAKKKDEDSQLSPLPLCK